jgi:hypothetical protein
VAIHENTIVAGARGDRTSATLGGAAYVFENNGAGWASADLRQLLPSDPVISGYFGSAVAIQDEIIVVGSPNDDDSGYNSGSAYVYTRNGADWITNPPIEAKLTASDGNVNDLYGSSVATNGVDVAIGAIYTDDQGNNSGSVYLYTRNGVDWTTTSCGRGGTSQLWGQSPCLSQKWRGLGYQHGNRIGFTEPPL